MKFGVFWNAVAAGLVAMIIYMFFALFTFRTLGGKVTWIAFLFGFVLYYLIFREKKEKEVKKKNAAHMERKH